MDSRNSELKSTVIYGAMIASLGTFNYGFNISSLNIPGSYVLQCPGVPKDVITYYHNSPIPQCIPMSDWIWGLATGFFALGGLLGALIASPMAERLGRRDSMMVINSTIFVGSLLLSLSTTSAQFALGRLFVGMNAGGMTVLVSMYIADTTPVKYRGIVGSCLQLFVTMGVPIAQIIGLGTSSPIGWRIVVMLSIVPAILQLLFLPFYPRSPRWLISKGRIDEARESLLRLRHGDIEQEFSEMAFPSSSSSFSKNDDDANQYKKDNEKHNLQQEQEQEQYNNHHPSGFQRSLSTSTVIVVTNDQVGECQTEMSLNFFQIMKIPVLAKLTVKVILIHAFQQVTGINAIVYYSTDIFESTFKENAKYATIGVGVLTLLATVVGSFFIDRLGRKMLLILSAAGMCLFGVLETIGLLYHIGPLQVVCILSFVAFFAIGLGIIPYVYTTEVFPTYAVGGASSAALMINWLCNFLVGLLFPTLQTIFGPYVFLIFAGFAFMASVFFIFGVIETNQKTIEQIGREFGWYGIDPTKKKNNTSSSNPIIQERR